MFEMRRPIEENISETRARFRGAPNFQELLGRSAWLYCNLHDDKEV